MIFFAVYGISHDQNGNESTFRGSFLIDDVIMVFRKFNCFDAYLPQSQCVEKRLASFHIPFALLADVLVS